MEGLLDFCETSPVLEEVMKHGLEKEVPAMWQVYNFSFTFVCSALNECLVLVKDA